MRVLRLMILIVGMLGGAIGLSVSANSAPIPASGIVGQTAEAPLVDKAQFYFVRRRYWRPRYYYRPRFYRRYYYRPRFYYRPRYYWRPRFYRRRFFF